MEDKQEDLGETKNCAGEHASCLGFVPYGLLRVILCLKEGSQLAMELNRVGSLCHWSMSLVLTLGVMVSCG